VEREKGGVYDDRGMRFEYRTTGVEVTEDGPGEGGGGPPEHGLRYRAATARPNGAASELADEVALGAPEEYQAR